MILGTKSNGMGDVLIINAVAKHFPFKYKVQLKKGLERYGILFDHIAEVEFKEEDEIEVLPDLNNPLTHTCIEKLRNFFGRTADTLNILPNVLHFDIDSHKKALSLLEGLNKPVIFNPFCSKRWADVRNIPDDLIEEIVGDLNKDGNDIVGCFSSNNSKDISGLAKTYYDLDLSVYIHLLRICGYFVGCNTGDMHLSAGVSCQVVVYNPVKGRGFHPVNWCYNHRNVKNYIFEK
jgi:hypothetical protein